MFPETLRSGGASQQLSFIAKVLEEPFIAKELTTKPPRRYLSTTLVHCQGPGELSIAEDQLVFLFAKDLDESLIAAPRI